MFESFRQLLMFDLYRNMFTKSLSDDIHMHIDNYMTMDTSKVETFVDMLQRHGTEALFNGQTPLFHAVKYKRQQHVKILLENKADIMTEYNGQSLVDVLKDQQSCEICGMILDEVRTRLKNTSNTKLQLLMRKLKKEYDELKLKDPEAIFRDIDSVTEGITKLEIGLYFGKLYTDTITYSLRCPIAQKKIIHAGKFQNCKHLECFDVKTFIEVFIGEFLKPRPNLKCPVPNCRVKTTKVTELGIHKYWVKIAKDSVSESILLSKDSTWTSFIPKTDFGNSMHSQNTNAASTNVSTSLRFIKPDPDAPISVPAICDGTTTITQAQGDNAVYIQALKEKEEENSRLTEQIKLLQEMQSLTKKSNNINEDRLIEMNKKEVKKANSIVAYEIEKRKIKRQAEARDLEQKAEIEDLKQRQLASTSKELENKMLLAEIKDLKQKLRASMTMATDNMLLQARCERFEKEKAQLAALLTKSDLHNQLFIPTEHKIKNSPPRLLTPPPVQERIKIHHKIRLDEKCFNPVQDKVVNGVIEID